MAGGHRCWQRFRVCAFSSVKCKLFCNSSSANSTKTDFSIQLGGKYRLQLAPVPARLHRPHVTHPHSIVRIGILFMNLGSFADCLQQIDIPRTLSLLPPRTCGLRTIPQLYYTMIWGCFWQGLHIRSPIPMSAWAQSQLVSNFAVISNMHATFQNEDGRP